jgi:hypothetical protein
MFGTMNSEYDRYIVRRDVWLKKQNDHYDMMIDKQNPSWLDRRRDFYNDHTKFYKDDRYLFHQTADDSAYERWIKLCYGEEDQRLALCTRHHHRYTSILKRTAGLMVAEVENGVEKRIFKAIIPYKLQNIGIPFDLGTDVARYI